MKMPELQGSMKDITLEVTINTRALDRRLWIAKQLIRLAATVLGCNIVISVSEGTTNEIKTSGTP